jgi:hypothetical protein
MQLTYWSKKHQGNGAPSNVRATIDQSIIEKCVNGQPRCFSKDDLLIDDAEDNVSFEILRAK